VIQFRHSRASGESKMTDQVNPACAYAPKGSGTPAFAGATKKETA
jgi:hypothetical protein